MSSALLQVTVYRFEQWTSTFKYETSHSSFVYIRPKEWLSMKRNNNWIHFTDKKKFLGQSTFALICFTFIHLSIPRKKMYIWCMLDTESTGGNRGRKSPDLEKRMEYEYGRSQWTWRHTEISTRREKILVKLPQAQPARCWYAGQQYSPSFATTSANSTGQHRW